MFCKTYESKFIKPFYFMLLKLYKQYYIDLYHIINALKPPTTNCSQTHLQYYTDLCHIINTL